MNASPADDPYVPPSASLRPPPATGSTAALATMRVVVWIFWIGLMLSYLLDWFTAAFQPRQEVAGPDPTLASILGVTALILLALAVFFRWLCFSYLIHPKRLQPGSWIAAGTGAGGALLVYALLKTVEVFGFILWLQSHSWQHYLAFAVPGCLLSVLAMPPWLMRRKATATSR